MKKHISLLLCFAMLGSLLCSTVLGADAATNNTVLFQLGNQSAYINGIEKQLPEAPQLINDRTMVPFRVLAESIGCSVEWIGETQSIVVTQKDNPSHKLKYKIGDTAIYKIENNNDVFYTNMDVAPLLSSAGNTLLPARYVAENFGYEADWADTYQAAAIFLQDNNQTAKSKKEIILKMLSPIAPEATLESFLIDQDRFAIGMYNEINRQLEKSGERKLEWNDKLAQVADYRAMECNLTNDWRIDSYRFADRQALYEHVLGKYYVPEKEIQLYAWNNAQQLVSQLKLDENKWNNIKDKQYHSIGIGVVKQGKNYRPVMILSGSSHLDS